MNINFNDPLSVLFALHKVTEEALGVPVSKEALLKTVEEILLKKHKTLYEERIRHLPPKKLLEIAELSKHSKDELEHLLHVQIAMQQAAAAKKEDLTVQQTSEEINVEASREPGQIQEEEGDSGVRTSKDKQQSGKQKKGKARN